MAHVRGANHINHRFREVLDVVADALEVAADAGQRQNARHGGGIGRDVGEQLGKQARVELVDVAVGLDYRGRLIGVLRLPSKLMRRNDPAPGPCHEMTFSANFAKFSAFFAVKVFDFSVNDANVLRQLNQGLPGLGDTSAASAD